jgi:tetratricopeptide (TPR) repeat protein
MLGTRLAQLKSDAPLWVIVTTLVVVFGGSSLAQNADSPPTWNMVLQQAIDAAHQGSFSRAEALLREGLTSLPNKQSFAAVVLWNQLGDVDLNQQRLAEAEKDFNQALAINSHLAVPSFDEEASALNDLATIAGERRQPAKAEALLHQAYESLEKAHHAEGRTAALVRANLALTLEQEGRYSDAETMYKTAEKMFSQASGDGNIEYARILANRALLEWRVGKYRDAADHGKRALAIQDKLAFVGRSDRALTLNNLGLSLGASGDFDGAESVMLQAARIEKAEPVLKDQLVSSLNNLANLERSRGRIKEAIQYEVELQRTLETGLKVDALTLCSIWNTFARSAEAEQNYRKAEELYNKALSLLEQENRQNDTYYAATLSNMAALESKRRHYKKAQALYERALEIDKSVLGATHPSVASDLSNIATQMFYLKKAEAALPLYQQAKKIQEQSLGPLAFEVARTWRNLAIAYLSVNQVSESVAAFSQALRAIDGPSGGQNPNLPSWLREYAGALRREQHFGDAEAAETRALGIEVRNTLVREKGVAREQGLKKNGSV